ncbi:MAG TPA: MopE-related protein, partial [Alphaproteobacteria bacterium]|nr:MopE-related protein [Alphaproteobacteria bacterium]
GCGHSACAWDDTYDLDKLNVASLTSWNGVALDPYDKNIYSWMLQYSKDCTTKTCGKLYDADADTYNNTADCNDNNANINPGKAEVCDNGLDDDCSGGDAVCQAVNNTLNSSKKINYLTSPNYNYGIYVPSGYYLSNNSNRNWPVVFFLHGSGERGTGMSTITKVATNGPLKLVNSGENFDMIIIAPQTDSWSWATAPTTFNITDDFVEEMFAKYRIDKKKVYLTGLSMGGEGSWDYAFNAPDKVAAIVSIAGDTNYRSQVCTLKNKVAAWAFHNRNDTAIGSYGQRVALIQALDNNCGSPSPDSNAKYTEYPLNSHNAWTQTYDGTGMGTENSSYDAFDQDIYSWMLSYSKDCSSGTCVFKKVVVDADSDGYNSAVDCNDNNANVNPGRTEVCGNGLDDDCSGGDATCAPTPTCSDGIMNGGELGIDCGGTCPNACTSLLTTGKKGTQYLFNVTGSGITGYILYLPPNYSPANDYPVMIFLHGAGEKFSGGYLNYTLLRKTAIPQMINNGYDLPFIVIMPQVGTTGDWNYAALSKVVTVLDSVAANYSVDSTRIYVTGLSMGGGGTNKFVEEYYQLPAAAVPIAGWGSVTCANTEKIPRWSFHNNIDTTVASSGSRNVYNNHKKCAGAVDPRLSIYNASGHDSWSKTYNLNGMYDIMQNGTGSINYTEEIYMWFMRYSRPELSGTTCFTCIVDYDNDGSKMNLDCNDGNASINPNAEEICGNTIDENCDGIKAGACPVAPVDSDSDGYNSTADCNDNNANVNPGETEVCGNGLDDDCSGGDATCAATPTCSDGIMNGDESGVDCGGSCAATCISSNPPSGINGLLVSYPFTANANDASGNSRNGIVSGATWSSLSSSGVYSFDGNDYITVTNGGELDGLSAFSLEAWVYNPNFTGSNEYIVGKRKDVNSSWGLYVETASAGFVFFINDTAKNIRTPATLGEWQYITTTWDGSTMKIYSNGVMTSSMSFDSNMNVYPTANVLVGARESATARTLHYNGKIGEVHIYNKALSSSEVQSRYDSTRGKYT